MSEKIQEHCGIIAYFQSKFSRQLSLTIRATTGVQHRGQQGAGLAMMTKRGLVTFRDNGLLREIFTPPVVKSLDRPSLWMLAHCRYGTFGDYHSVNIQPIVVKSHQNDQAVIIHNGQFSALGEMKRKIKNPLPPGASDTLVFAHFLAQIKAKNWRERIIKALAEVKGAYALAIGVGQQVFLARDPWGIRPLFLGKANGGWLAASETHAFNKVGGEVLRMLLPGEIVCLDRDKMITLRRGKNEACHFCDFEWAYFARPDSFFPIHEGRTSNRQPKDWLSAGLFRERCGEIIAQEMAIKNASFVVGVPDSGLTVGTGYALALNLPYRQVIVRDHYDQDGNQRLFMRDDDKKSIAKKVIGKLSLTNDKRIWKNAVVVVGDDSIVRGNVSGQITKAIFAAGAREVHWILGFPPVAYPCPLGVSMRAGSELIASRFKQDPKKIARAIGATSVNYISTRGFLTARLKGVARVKKASHFANGGCGGCLTGVYPV